MSRRVRGGWLIEGVVVFGLYRLYSWLRIEVTGSTGAAFRQARQLIHWQDGLGINREVQIQSWFLPYRWFIGFWNIWYGTVHFVMPVVTLVWLYRSDPTRYVRWRNTFLWMLPVALLGFWLYPLMPPRLLPHRYGFLDTRLFYFTIGEPTPHAQEGGNLFAAMPSLHIGFSTFTTIALWPLVRRWWSRALLVLYPAAMLFSIVVTANHYLLDAVGGWIALAIGYTLASAPDWWRNTHAVTGRPRIGPPIDA